MKKPNIIRFQQCKFFPDKPHYSDEELTKYFLNQTIIITEKYDGTGVYDKDYGILFEDLSKPSTIEYDTRYYNTKILIAEVMDAELGLFVPNIDGDYNDRYGQLAPCQKLFCGEVDNLDDLKTLVKILKKQRTHMSSMGGITMEYKNRMEGVVIFSYESRKWAKCHNDWFMEILVKAESKHKRGNK